MLAGGGWPQSPKETHIHMPSRGRHVGSTTDAQKKLLCAATAGHSCFLEPSNVHAFVSKLPGEGRELGRNNKIRIALFIIVLSSTVVCDRYVINVVVVTKCYENVRSSSTHQISIFHIFVEILVLCSALRNVAFSRRAQNF